MGRRRWLLYGGVALALGGLLALGCRWSGDGPLRFLLRLFTLDYVPALEAGASLLTVALFGFLTSFHCIGMCGGVVLSQCAGRERGGLYQNLAYNGGRIVSCTLVGLLAGALGSLIGLNGYWRGLAPLVCAAVMLAMGLRLLGLLGWLKLGEGRAPGLLDGLARHGPFLTGFLTGFLPCGMLQIAQLHALGGGSAWKGALSMLVFAAASSPVLFAFGALSGALTPKKRALAMKAAAVLVLLMAVKMLLKALRVMGVIQL